ncbi:MAG: hypothetical protein AABX89_04945 [Candidatus Thermoplasmatota archaeon]
MRLVLVVALAMLVPALAGCASVKDAAESAAESAGITLPSSSSTASSSAAKANVAPTANLTANLVNGTAPLNVTFTLAGADPEGKPITWSFVVGNITQNGTVLPALVNATLEAGNFTARLTVSDGALTATDRFNLTILAGAPVVARAAPDPTVFEFPESFGCVGDLATCFVLEMGPDASGIDGFWQVLDERYWGYLATNTATGNVLGDSDCNFYAPDATTVLGEGNNGGAACTGIVPEGTGWILLYSYAEPSTGMTLEFTLPA